MNTVFTLWKQADRDLIGLFFPQLADLDPASVEVIDQEFIDGYFISAAAGTTTANAAYKYAITDVSDYDYVLIPSGLLSPGTPLCGLCAGAGTGLSPRFAMSANVGYTETINGYMCIPVDETNHYTAVSQLADVDMPLLGIKLQS